MNMSLMQIVAAIAMVSITVTLVFAYRKYLATNSKRRVVTMLAAVGFVHELAPSGDCVILMKEARMAAEAVHARTCVSVGCEATKRAAMPFVRTPRYLKHSQDTAA
jgi:hypothetical protein